MFIFEQIDFTGVRGARDLNSREQIALGPQAYMRDSSRRFINRQDLIVERVFWSKEVNTSGRIGSVEVTECFSHGSSPPGLMVLKTRRALPD